VFFGSKKEKLKKVAEFAEALARGETQPFILDESDPLSYRLTKALNQIADLLSARYLELEKESSHLEGILETIQEGVLLTDAEGGILLANKALCELFQVKKEPTGKSLIEVFRHEKIQEVCDQLLQSPGRVSFDLDLGIVKETALRVNFSSMRSAKANKTLGVVGVFIDMTQVKKLEKMRKEFVANISHELKTPLSSIKGYSETLIQNCPREPERVREFAQIIHRNAQRLEHLVEDIMALSRLEQKKEILHKSPIDLLLVAREVCQQLSHLAQLSQVRLEVVSGEPLPLIIADEEKIKKVFTAILENAIKYAGEGKRALVRAKVLEGKVQVCIEDNGPGIPKEALPSVFERFYRVEKSRSRDVGGSGLGLAIAKHIVLAHEGEIWVESPPGQGASFYFTLPIVTES
jgi:two-component system phosphate regulon sensor histidine kinase PhoR